MPVPLLPILALGATGAGAIAFGSVLPEEPLADAGITDPAPPVMNEGSGGFELSPAILIAGFIALLVFGRTAIQEVL